ncbi:hypothetical protein FA15DRAFT_756794 [Coprinopsis marcescibilis]|uniref:Extracellular membrane protein CFEM domain-containing protein n=1 Tax=Coprinopsis marcescibilis TaxID=230819 RepID=A0A5C3KU19_COPMA|nr:hypothetical protein FA15DRAFT_756794 [Coprinopsis marcescibilis]
MRLSYLFPAFIVAAYANAAILQTPRIYARQNIDDITLNIPSKCNDQCSRATARSRTCRNESFSTELKARCICRRSTVTALEACFPCLFKAANSAITDSEVLKQGQTVINGMYYCNLQSTFVTTAPAVRTACNEADESLDSENEDDDDFGDDDTHTADDGHDHSEDNDAGNGTSQGGSSGSGRVFLNLGSVAAVVAAGAIFLL